MRRGGQASQEGARFRNSHGRGGSRAERGFQCPTPGGGLQGLETPAGSSEEEGRATGRGGWGDLSGGPHPSPHGPPKCNT